MKTLFYKIRHTLRKHQYEDYSVGLMICYYCETCGLQKTQISSGMWWYRVAPWLKESKEFILKANSLT